MRDEGRRVGVRELRQNLTVHLRTVRAGRSLEVTDRGRVVAALVPLPEDATPLERLIGAGRATGPEGDLIELGPPRGRVSGRLSQALAKTRSERL